MFGLGTTEILLIVAVLFLLFGTTRLPQLAKSLGQSRKAFKEGLREAEEEPGPAPPSVAPAAPQLSQMTDEDLAAEMERRAGAKRVS